MLEIMNLCQSLSRDFTPTHTLLRILITLPILTLPVQSVEPLNMTSIRTEWEAAGAMHQCWNRYERIWSSLWSASLYHLDCAWNQASFANGFVIKKMPGDCVLLLLENEFEYFDYERSLLSWRLDTVTIHRIKCIQINIFLFRFRILLVKCIVSSLT